ncbi:hypothetical protein FHX69_2587 [Prauserella muralis]|nr:hypothetical protein FHX69_2587 [Prauserella muralis]
MRKTCRTCGGSKPLNAFRHDARRDDGRATQCRACAQADGAAYREANLERVRERERVNAAAYRANHPNRRRMIARESARRMRRKRAALARRGVA